MTAKERARLNRRAAELAGWTFEVRASVGALGITVYTAAYTEPGGERHVVGVGPDEWVQRAALEAHVPDFLSDPALWWGLVERMAGLVEEDGPLLWWVGPAHRPEGWEVQFFVKGQSERQRFSAPTAGVAAVGAVVEVAEALGLAPAAAPGR